MTQPTMLSVRQVAEYFRVTTKTVYGWAQHGVLPFVKIGGVLRIDRADIARYLRDNRHGGT